MKNLKLLLPAIFVTLLLPSCASKAVYTPEIQGKGAMHTQDSGILYSIPPKDPVMKMKVVSTGIDKNKMMVIRLYILRTGAAAPAQSAYLVPAEQTLVFGSRVDEVHALRVHAAASAKKKRVELLANARQTIELAFPVPTDFDPSRDIESFTFHSSLHYGKKQLAANATVFDKKDTTKNAPQADEFYDLTDESKWVLDNWIWW